jgi:hypothetical protein
LNSLSQVANTSKLPFTMMTDSFRSWDFECKVCLMGNHHEPCKHLSS